MATKNTDRERKEIPQRLAADRAEVESRDKDKQYLDSTYDETDRLEDTSVMSDDSSTLLPGSNPSSTTSINILAGSVDELAELLLRDHILGTPLANLQKIVTMDIFERELSQLLTQFGINLLAEAIENPEKLTAQFVKERATKVASHVRWKLDPVKNEARNRLRLLSAQDPEKKFSRSFSQGTERAWGRNRCTGKSDGACYW